MRSVSFRGPSKMIFYLLCIIGLLSAVANVIQTTNPHSYFGNDVFDSPSHPWSFVLAKVFLFLSWGLIFPICGFIVIHAGVILPLILGSLYREGLIEVDFFHQDGCGGLSNYGRINFLSMAIYLAVFIFMIALRETHAEKYYASFTLPLAAMSILFIAQSFFGVFYIHKAISNERRRLLLRLNEALRERLQKDIASDRFSDYGLLALRRQVVQVRSFPYSELVGKLVNLLRVAPALISISRLIRI